MFYETTVPQEKHSYHTIASFAQMQGLRTSHAMIAVCSGNATRISKERGIEKRYTHPAKIGQVAYYRKDVLSTVFRLD